ncbi:MAG: HRDC domain-containing protein, partial [Pseudomonadota bacterium]
GLGRDRSKPWWQAFLRQLVSAGRLEIDIQGFGGLKISETGQQILAGTAGFECREQITSAATPKRQQRQTRGTAETAELDDDGQALLAKLKKLRMSLARARGVPTYVIFHDRTLIAMVTDRPADRAGFLALPGVGEKKAKDFAAPFLAAIADPTVEDA